MSDQDAFAAWLRAYLADLLAVDPASLEMTLSLNHYGIDSQDALVMSGMFCDAFAVEIDPGLFLADDSLDDLTAALVAAVQASSAR